jgi:Spy/CpxP family protein refolding chaperone
MSPQIKALAAFFSVVVSTAIVSAYAGWRLAGYQRVVSERPIFVYEELNLSKVQRERMVASCDRFLTVTSQIGGRIIGTYVELVDLIGAETLDWQAIETKLQEIDSGQQSLQQVMAGHLIENRRMLTPDQRTRFFAVLQSRIRAQASTGPPWFPPRGRQSQRPRPTAPRNKGERLRGLSSLPYAGPMLSSSPQF